jgi:ribonuclease HI
MKLAREMEVTNLQAKSDSQLVTNQVSGDYQTKDPQLIKYLEKVQSLAAQFERFELICTKGAECQGGPSFKTG